MTCDAGSERNAKFNQYRRFLAQFLATTVENMLLFDMGCCNTFVSIVIPALTGIANQHNINETLSLTAIQASWLGSIGFISEPVGSILSALINDCLGRKGSMVVVNIPIVIAWFLMYNASSVVDIFIATTLLGLGAGLMESSLITYVGEISEPKYRGVMIAYTHVGWTLGLFFISALNVVMPWRTVAFVCMFIPIVSTFTLYFIPETPLWLLGKNRTEAAEKSLCWLRGWVPKKAVADEFQSLQRYSERYKSCNPCIKQNVKCPHPQPTMIQKLGELKRQQTLKPFFIVMSLFVISLFSGLFGMSPFIIQIFKAYDSPIAPDKAAALLGVVNNLGNLTFLCLIRITGKRRLYLSMLSIVFLCAAVISVYGFAVLPSGYNSFDHSKHVTLDNQHLKYIPFTCLILWNFATFCAVNTMPWQILSEVFPYKTRGTATGITAALNYVISFIATKTYYDLETNLSLPGVALFNCVVVAGGLVLMYYILPVTENRTLEDIEMHFADKTKKLTDWKISKNKAVQGNNNGTSPAYITNRPSNGCDNRAFSNE